MVAELGKEYPIANEGYWFDRIIMALKQKLAAKYPPGKTLRFFHPKTHGVVKATFAIEPNLPEKLRVGLFSAPKDYPCWVRFSKTSPTVAADIKKDFRGIAIKLMNVPGEKVLEYHKNAQTQDFVLVSQPVFRFNTLPMLARGVEAVCYGIWSKVKFGVMYLPFALKSLGGRKYCTNVFELQYWTQLPHRFGAPDCAVKYTVIPRKPATTPVPKDPDYNFLTQYMVKDLSENDIFFDFCVQFQENPDTEPIEDCAVEWKTPFHKVATLRIPKQQFFTPEIVAFGEQLSYSPWHCLPQHIPIGFASRARKPVYETLARFRHERNGQPYFEPTEQNSPEVHLLT